ncbi:MAG: radical SAM protein [Synergistetes bacterium]|nr:radical SAM protein [Synergistota bacterium]MCX8127556.1 radical SAM protein [Synergistota bacterium]MDW8191527.1 radical SAM protein [Synergistota bacterium]
MENPRIEELEAIASPCRLCPHKCEANRKEGKAGFCRVPTLDPIVSSYGPHFGEESFLVGRGGSGTIFFTYCNMKCVFCQNYDISQLGSGRVIKVEDLAKIMLILQRAGCHNINLVTPTPHIYSIAKAIELAKSKGLELPIVYNCGGYESVETLKLLRGLIDIYMPDFKYGDSEVGEELSKVKNYTEIALQAIEEMLSQVGHLEIGPDGIAKKGVFIRHLIMPNDAASSFKALELLAKNFPGIAINIMDQYYPTHLANNYPKISRRINTREWGETLKFARALNIRVVS